MPKNSTEKISATLSIYSWNVNGLRSVISKGALQNLIDTEQPDILCLQEIKAKPEQVNYDFPGYKVFWHPARKPGYSGTAILYSDRVAGLVEPKIISAEIKVTTLNKDSSSQPSLDITEEVNLATQEGRVLVVDFGKFYLVNVYTPNSKNDLSRLRLREQEWDPGFLELLQDLEQTKPVITCGDFNAAHTEMDLARPKSNHKNAGFTVEERRGITNLINAGFIDTFRTLNPTVQRYTWWSHWGNARANNVGWRIDYFFISKSIESNLKYAGIYEHYLGSDHCPISIEVQF